MTKNYFQLLNIQQKYNIDKVYLKSQYLKMQNNSHPDRAFNEDQRSLFLNKSIKVNEAYQTLKDDCLRAEYIIKLSNFSSRTSLNTINSNNNFLASIMKTYEIFESTINLSDLKSIKYLQIQKKNDIINKLEIYFDTYNFTKALDFTVRLKYITSLVNEITLKIKNASSRDF